MNFLQIKVFEGDRDRAVLHSLIPTVVASILSGLPAPVIDYSDQ